MSSHTNKHYAKLRFMSTATRGPQNLRVDLKYHTTTGPIEEREWWGRFTYQIPPASLGEDAQPLLAFDVGHDDGTGNWIQDDVVRLGFFLNLEGESNLDNPKFLCVPPILVGDIVVTLSDNVVSMTVFSVEGLVLAGQQWEF